MNQFYKMLIVTTIIFNTSTSYSAHGGKMTVSAGKGDAASAVKAAGSTPSISAESPHKGKTGGTFLPGFVGPKRTGTVVPYGTPRGGWGR